MNRHRKNIPRLVGGRLPQDLKRHERMELDCQSTGSDGKKGMVIKADALFFCSLFPFQLFQISPRLQAELFSALRLSMRIPPFLNKG